MRSHVSTCLALSLILASACGAAPPHAVRPQEAAASQVSPVRSGLQIKLVTVYVDDQEQALRFYTDVLGFAKKDDVTNGPYRWLSVTDTGGNELQLAQNDNPAAKAFQQALFQQSQPAIMFYTDDVKGDYERIKARGAEFTMPPTEVMAGSVIATLKDTCGNLVQLTQLAR
jgi:predicted enzyme related to lactoylglutathione lyase